MALTQVSSGLIDSTAQYTGFKNRIINGDCRIDQRNAGASVTPNSSAYTLDRWQLSTGVSSKLSVQQSSTAPTGFTNSVLLTSTSAYTPSSSDYISYCQKVEGFNFADMMWGTANAATVTLSFWVRSSLTGTFSGALQNDGASRSYPFTFTISAANTFEYKTITIAGDTSGTWNTTTGKGVEVHFNMGSGSNLLGTAGAWASAWRTGATGSVSLVGTSGATLYITGVQLEKGSTATSFDYRPYGTELALCQRYYEKTYSTGTAVGTNTSEGYISFTTTSNNNSFIVWAIRPKVEKRAAPTVTGWTPTGTSGNWDYYRSGASGSNSFLSDNMGTSGGRAYTNIGAAWTAGSIEGQWAMSAEL
jgi:hypothetical protein